MTYTVCEACSGETVSITSLSDTNSYWLCVQCGHITKGAAIDPAERAAEIARFNATITAIANEET